MSIDNSSKEESSHYQDVKAKECLCGPNKRQQMADHNYSNRDGGERGKAIKTLEGGIKEKQGFLGIQKHWVSRGGSVPF